MAKGQQIASFFARVGFKVDAKELKKVETHLNKLSKSFTKVASDFEKASNKIQQAMNKIGTSKRSPKSRSAPVTPKDKGSFTSEGFFSKESNLRSMTSLTDRQQKAVRRLTAAYQKQGVSLLEANVKVKTMIASRKRLNKQHEIATRRLNKLSFAQQRVVSSSRQLIGSYIGVFGAISAVNAIKDTGQQLEAARAGMLAVSKGASDAASGLAFIDTEAVRLGLDLAQTTKGFVKMKAVQKEMKEEDLREVFLGIAEAGTALQLSQDDITGSIRAVQQMMAKGTIMAEEYRLQLADRLPSAMVAMEKATGLTGKALSKAMEQGKLISNEILPKFGRELRKIANNNGALTKILNTNRVAQGRMTTAYQKFMDVIFTSGFGDALTALFDQITKSFKDLKGIGVVIGKIFTVITGVITGALSAIRVPLETLSKIFEVMGMLFDKMDTGFGHFADTTVPRLVGALGILLLMGKRLGKTFMIVSAVLIGIKAVIEEIIGLTHTGVMGSLERQLGRDIDITKEGGMQELLTGEGEGNNLYEQMVENMLGWMVPDDVKNGGSVVFNNATITAGSRSELIQEANSAKVSSGQRGGL